MKQLKQRSCALALLLSITVLLSGCDSGTGAVTSTAATSQPNQVEEVESTLSAADRSREIWEEFLTSGNYKTYLTEYAADYTQPSVLQYVIYDINADNVPELLIESTYEEFNSFYTTWVFTLQGDTIHCVDAHYGYGHYGYSPSQNAVIVSPEWKPFGETADWPFYRLNETSFDFAFSLTASEGAFYYYSAEGEEKTISKTEYRSYFADETTFEWNRIGSLQKVEHSAKPDLASYLGTDISSFVNMTDGMEKLDSSDGTTEYSNGAIIVSAPYDSHAIDFISIRNDCDYSIKGIEYGMSFEAATELATRSCRSIEDDEPHFKYFIMDDGTELSLYTEDEQVVDSINLFAE